MNLESLNRKVYGLPVWAWAAIAGIVLIAAFRFFKNRAGGGTASVSPFPQDRIRVADSVETPVAQEGQG